MSCFFKPNTDGLLAVDISSSRSSSHCQESPDQGRPIQEASHSTPHQHTNPNSHSLSNSVSLSLDHAAAKEMFVPQGPSSIETLLTNIQGLLKVAADNARQQEEVCGRRKAVWQGYDYDEDYVGNADNDDGYDDMCQRFSV